VTHENRRAAIADEIAHGDAAHRAAQMLRDGGLSNDALSRLYYALFHYATALLLTEGVEPTSHKALPGLFGLHFVRSGRMTPSEAAVLGHAWQWRTLADYERTWNADAEATSKAFGEIEPLIVRIGEILRAGDWIARR
jgi:uncharacterized protein (UPF0332 family)